MFQLHDISYKIKAKTLLNNVSCAFECGEVTAIIGPNGAGKSTLLKVLSGMLTPSYGAISYDYKNIKTYSEKELSLQRAYLSQNPNAAFDFLVEEVVMIGRYPHMQFQPTKNDYEIVSQALKQAGVEHLAKQSTITLSGGELQRVHFARTLAQIWPNGSNKSSLFILDEPVNSLDPKYQHQLLETVQQLATTQQFAMVVVLHDLNLALQYANKLVALKNGQLIAQGSTQSILNETLIEELYQIEASIFKDNNGIPHVVYGTASTFNKTKTNNYYERTYL